MKLKIKKESAASKKIQAIYDAHGGTNKCAVKLGISAQLLSRWKINGKIPLKKVADVAIKLKVDPMTLNEAEISRLYFLLTEWR